MTIPDFNSGAVLAQTMMQYRSGDLSTVEFCDAYERLFNLETDKDALPQADRRVFQQLFEEVIWYSPFPDDRARYAGYRDDHAIRLAVEQAWHALSLKP